MATPPSEPQSTAFTLPLAKLPDQFWAAPRLKLQSWRAMELMPYGIIVDFGHAPTQDPKFICLLFFVVASLLVCYSTALIYKGKIDLDVVNCEQSDAARLPRCTHYS